MEMTSLLVGLLAGIMLGALAYAWWSRQRAGDTLAPVRDAHAQEKADLQQRLDGQAREANERTRELMDLNAQLAAEAQRARGLQEKLDNQQADLEKAQARMTTEFEVIANKLLTARGRELNEQQQTQLTSILKPLNEKIKDFEEQVRKAYDSEGRERFALKGEIMKLVEQNQKLGQEANDLTKALKGDSQAQGAWGEMILEKLLESSGLMPDQEYSMQESTTLSDGSRLRPDAVIMLPEGKHLIIDSKVSLLHYERFAASSDPAEKDRLLKQHVESLRAHARGLSEKDYTKLYAVNSVDFVLMFVPIEPAFLLALRERPEIFQEAYDRQVVMVTHSTLMATLRTIHGIWKNERIARNHLEIADRAGRLYDKFIGFTEDLIKVGNQLKLAKGSYDEAMGKLSEGSGNLVRQVELIKELGAKSNKVQNDRLLQRALEE